MYCPVAPERGARLPGILDAMFGMDQITALGDMVQGAVMLRYHKRLVG